MTWSSKPNAPASGTVLCQLDDIPDGEARGFDFGPIAQPFRLFVVRQGRVLYGYVNECPHAFTPLDWTPDKFFNLDHDALICSTHGAQFQIQDGYCFLGPCKGRSLDKVPVHLAGDEIRVGPSTQIVTGPCGADLGSPNSRQSGSGSR